MISGSTHSYQPVDKYSYIRIWNASISKNLYYSYGAMLHEGHYSIDFCAGSFMLSEAFTIPSPTGLAFIKNLTGLWFANSFPELAYQTE